MRVEILGIDSGGHAEREANSAMRGIVLADTTQTPPLGSRTVRFLYAPTLRQRSQDHAEHSSRPSRSYFLQDSHNSFSYCGLPAMRNHQAIGLSATRKSSNRKLWAEGSP
jgi:hypothetical protein